MVSGNRTKNASRPDSAASTTR